MIRIRLCSCADFGFILLEFNTLDDDIHVYIDFIFYAIELEMMNVLVVLLLIVMRCMNELSILECIIR